MLLWWGEARIGWFLDTASHSENDVVFRLLQVEAAKNAFILSAALDLERIGGWDGLGLEPVVSGNQFGESRRMHASGCN